MSSRRREHHTHLLDIFQKVHETVRAGKNASR